MSDDPFCKCGHRQSAHNGRQLAIGHDCGFGGFIRSLSFNDDVSDPEYQKYWSGKPLKEQRAAQRPTGGKK